MEDIAELVADLEADRKGIPVLLRQYLNLGGRLLAFNLDPQFSDVVDGLILVDLLETEEKQLVRYLGREGTEAFLSHHAANHQRIVSPGA
jgi:tryptophan synthase alpha subunit